MVISPQRQPFGLLANNVIAIEEDWRGRSLKNAMLINGSPGRTRTADPECPKWIKGEAKREWLWITPRLARYGLIAELDRTLLEQYVIAYARWREAEVALNRGDIVTTQTRANGATYPV